MQKGDFIQIEFVGRIALTGEIFDLTSEQEAKLAGIYNPNHKYGPQLVIIGAGMVIPGLEKALETMSVGEEKEITIKPEQAFGQRNANLIKIISLSNFLAKNINAVPGHFVEIDGLPAKILSVAGGRVRVDFNHPLAGKELKYKVKIVRKITDTMEKVQLLLAHYAIKAEPKIDGQKLILKMEKKLPKDVQDLISKPIIEWVSEIKEVIFEENRKA
jgi:FKBP-type peptidyl-prolyl cis-trans isomerase 2